MNCVHTRLYDVTLRFKLGMNSYLISCVTNWLEFTRNYVGMFIQLLIEKDVCIQAILEHKTDFGKVCPYYMIFKIPVLVEVKFELGQDSGLQIMRLWGPTVGHFENLNL